MPQETEKKLMFKHVAAVMCVFLAVISCIFTIDFNVDAAGSKNLTATQDPNTGAWNTNTGYRPYIEWNNLTMAGIVRHQIIKVYVNAGETLYFGSSVSNGSGGDIIVKAPGGNPITYDVIDDVDAIKNDKIDDEIGYINTRDKELAGPNYSGTNSAGYVPLSILVADGQTGVWEFEFHSPNPTMTDNNPPLSKISDPIRTDSAVGVAAWDVTVVATSEGVQSEVTGRVFANFLSLNMGGNKNGENVLNSKIYVLTNDGYIYETDFNGMDPYGFFFFANNRGLVKGMDNLATSTSLYQSGIATNDAITEIKSGPPNDTITARFYSPLLPDEGLDSTYKIFFEVPSNDLPPDIKTVPYAPGKIDNFSFVGDTTGHGFVGDGGVFSFYANKGVSSFQIKLDFTNYKNENGGIENRGIVYLSNACLEGTNTISWNGRDGNGAIVPAGNLVADNKVSITITAKAGEYHFPMLDVENNKNGIIIRMINDPDDGENLLAADDPQRTTVFYNNSYVTGIKNEYSNSLASLNMLEGMSSMTGASKFGMTTGYYSAGNYSAIDIWTYFTGGANHLPEALGELKLDEPPEPPDISGLVFYDANQDGDYDENNDEFPLSGIAVDLSTRLNGNHWSTPIRAYTDADGMYYFDGTIGKIYKIEVIKPYTSAIFSTSMPDQKELTEGNPIIFKNMGIYFERQKIIVNKVWAVSSDLDSIQPDSVKITVIGKYVTYAGNTVTPINKSITLSSDNNWQYTFNDLPKFVYVTNWYGRIMYQLVYTVSEDSIAGYTSTPPMIVTTATDTYTFTNTPKGRITLTKVDAYDTSEKLGGAVFDLYKRTASGAGTQVKTALTTDADGKIFVQDLLEGTYYFVETTAPSGYTLDPAHSISADIVVGYTADTFNKSITVTNEKKCNFTLTKKITQTSAVDEQFLFEVTGPAGIYYAVITIAAGDTTASQAFVGMPAGTYSVVEKNSNWRYTLETDAAQPNYTMATNGTDTLAFADDKLSMPIQDSLNANYLFTFVDKKSIDQWVSDHASVTNTMVIP